jgi:hypothetical protein
LKKLLVQKEATEISKIKTLPQIVKLIKSEDPGTAFNESMLIELINSSYIPSGKRGNRIVADVDEINACLNQLLGLEASKKLSHIRTIRNAAKEIKEKFPDLGIGEKQIRTAIADERVNTINIGNRSYIALEFFEEPDISRFFSYDFNHITKPKPNRAIEEINEILSRNNKRVKISRVRK